MSPLFDQALEDQLNAQICIDLEDLESDDVDMLDRTRYAQSWHERECAEMTSPIVTKSPRADTHLLDGDIMLPKAFSVISSSSVSKKGQSRSLIAPRSIKLPNPFSAHSSSSLRPPVKRTYDLQDAWDVDDVIHLQTLLLRWDLLRDNPHFVQQEIAAMAKKMRSRHAHRKGELVLLELQSVTQPHRFDESDCFRTETSDVHICCLFVF
jgi:hypothetical protein